MSTIQKRPSAEALQMNEPVLKRRSTLVELNIVDRYAEIIAAWSAGKFNVGDIDAAIDEFFTEGAVVDVQTSSMPLRLPSGR